VTTLTELRNIAHELSQQLYHYRADYLEIHLEESTSSYISYRGQNLDTAGRGSDLGGNVRALVNGGWGFVSFNSLDDIRKRIDLAIHQASLAGSTQSQFASAPSVTYAQTDELSQSSVERPLEDKKRILDEYKDLIWQTKGIKTSFIRFSDGYRRRFYVNSRGSVIEQSRSDINFNATAIASGDGELQQSNISVGSRGNYNAITGLHSQIKDMTEHAVKLLSAPKVKGGEYTVILDPILAGVFVHEAFGHLSEADHIYENPQMREVMVLGKKFGPKILNIIDNPTMPDLRGSYKYDDEGVAATKNYLIREGKLTGRLHSRETAAKMNEPLSGNARAISYRYAPIVRMSNTYIEPGVSTLEEMLDGVKEGIYVKNWYGGTTSMEMLTFSSGEAYMIRDGKIAEALRPVVLSGNVFDTLHNIDMIGNDLDMNQGGGCGKSGQSPLPVSNGSPHIRIQKCLVGGA